jgi:hypothetical protein
VDPAVVEPVDPFQRCELQVVEAAPWTVTTYQFRLVQSHNRLGHGVVVRISLAADRSYRPCLSQPFGVTDREVRKAGADAGRDRRIHTGVPCDKGGQEVPV